MKKISLIISISFIALFIISCTAARDIIIIFSPKNPLVNERVNLGAKITGSHGPFTWTIVGPSDSQSTFIETDGLDGYFIPDKLGHYRVTLASDSFNRTVSIFAKNIAAEITSQDFTNRKIGEPITLDGSKSRSNFGEVSYSWNIENRIENNQLSNTNTETTIFTPDESATYDISLTVSDSEGNSATTYIKVETEFFVNAGEDNSIFVTEDYKWSPSNSHKLYGINGAEYYTYGSKYWEVISYPEYTTGSRYYIYDDGKSIDSFFSASQAGEYVLRYSANSDARKGSDTVTITVFEKIKPTANAGNEQTVALNSTVALDASNSSDLNSNPLTYEWFLYEGPENVLLSDSTSVSPSFQASTAGVYIFKLRVRNAVLTSEDTDESQVIINVLDTPAPIANAGVDRTVTQGNAVSLDGRGSSDSEDRTLTYSWEITSKPSESSALLSNSSNINPSFVADVAGIYSFQLIVNNGIINSTVDSVTITVEELEEPAPLPIANPGANQTVTQGDTVSLDGRGSSDSEDRTLTYFWEITSKPSGSSALLSNSSISNPSFIADIAGTYLVELTVNNGITNSPVNSVTITTELLEEPVLLPIADAGGNQTVTQGDTVSLDGRGSSDSEDRTLTYSWQITSKPSGSSALLSNSSISNPSFIADIAGIYSFQLIVNNGITNSSADSVTITVEVSNDFTSYNCSDINILKSPMDTLDSDAHDVTVENNSSGSLKMVWIDEYGEFIDYSTIASGNSYVQETFPGDIWLLENSSGHCITIFKSNNSENKTFTYSD